MGARHDELLSRFELAPPRHFLLPAVLLLLSEEPSYGYNLVKALSALRFGPVDRPSVYRTLAQLERDELVESWSVPPTAGQERRVYGLTAKGDRALRTWMGVIKEERDVLDRVLRRYAATGTPDAVLAEAEGELGSAAPLSTVASSARLGPVFRLINRPDEHPWADGPESDVVRIQRYRVLPERSAVLIEACSTVGPITFGAVGLTGFVDAEVRGGVIWPQDATVASLDVPVTGLSSGNSLYDAELLRRIEARRYPVARLELRDCLVVGGAGRYRLTGELDFHGVVRSLEGTVTIDPWTDDTIVVTGEHAFDIRDFDIASPTVLMLRIYPDVTVKLQVEAVPVGRAGAVS